MKRIPLTQNQYAIVDDEDFDFLMRFRWHAWQCPTIEGRFYARRNYRVGETGYPGCANMHRVVTGAPKGVEVDHINLNGLDNRKENLRTCSRVENLRNARGWLRPHSSKFKGVSWEKRRQKWRVQVQVNGKKLWGGYYDNELEAAEAYNKIALAADPTFYRVNS